MAISRAAYTRATFPLTLPKDRFFSLSWDNSKSRKVDAGKTVKQEATGAKFVNGRVSLDNGQVFESQNEMETLLGLAGNYTVTFEDEI